MRNPNLPPEAGLRWEARARVLKAAAHPTRLYLLDRLSQGEVCVCELTAEVGADVSTVSKHLAVLRSAGLVLDEKRGAQVFYRLAAPDAPRLALCADAVLAAQARRSSMAAGAAPLRVAGGRAR